MKPATTVIDSDASYHDIQQNIHKHHFLKNIITCARAGAAIFIYKGCTRKVLAVLPGGTTQLVTLSTNNNIFNLHTEPGKIYILAYQT